MFYKTESKVRVIILQPIKLYTDVINILLFCYYWKQDVKLSTNNTIIFFRLYCSLHLLLFEVLYIYISNEII